MKHFIVLGFIVFSFFYVNGQTVTTWQGPSTGGSWNDPANWDNGVPGNGGAPREIVFDGSLSTLTGNVITITDVTQTAALFAYNRLTVNNNAIVTLSSSAATYLYFTQSINIEAGSRLNLGAATTAKFEFGGDLSTVININGTLDMQGQGNSSNPVTFFPTTYSFGSTVVSTIKGKVILSGLNARFTSNANIPLFENGSMYNITRDGGTVPKANFKNGSLIKIQGVVTTPSSFNSSAIYEGAIEWNCPGQTISGSSAIIMPTTSFNSFDSLIVVNTGVGRSIRLTTNPDNFYVKNIIMNGGTLELSSPGGSGVGVGLAPYRFKVDNIIQNGGTIIGNAPGVAGFDQSYVPDTLKITGSFIQNAGVFDFSTRAPVNVPANASFVMEVAGDVLIGGTVKLTKPVTSPDCAIIFNGTGTQNFTVVNPGIFSNKIKTVINNTSLFQGVNLASNVSLPDSLVFKSGYLFLNSFDLTNPLPVQFGTTDFSKHVVTNGTGYFIQKKIKAVLLGLPIGATTTTFNPLSLNVIIDSMDIAARVEIGLNPTIVFPNIAVNRTWRIKPVSPVISDLAISFGYIDLGPGLGDGNPAFSYTANNEVGLNDGTAWQVVSLPGGYAPVGPNPYAISHLILKSQMAINTVASLAVGNVSSITPIANVINLQASKLNNKSILKWGIAEIAGAARFEILRSLDGRNFGAIGSTLLIPNQSNYTYTDYNLLPGTNYYRIRMIGADGRSKFSAIVAIINKETGLLVSSIIPSLVCNNAVMMVSSAKKSTIQFVVTDMQGKIVKKVSSIVYEGNNEVQLDCISLASGSYQVAGYSEADKTNVIRFVKQ